MHDPIEVYCGALQHHGNRISKQKISIEVEKTAVQGCTPPELGSRWDKGEGNPVAGRSALARRPSRRQVKDHSRRDLSIRTITCVNLRRNLA